MKKYGKVNFWISLISSIVILVHAIMGIVMYFDSGTTERPTQMERPVMENQESVEEPSEGQNGPGGQTGMQMPPDRGEMRSSFSMSVMSFASSIGGLVASGLLLLLGAAGLFVTLKKELFLENFSKKNN